MSANTAETEAPEAIIREDQKGAVVRVGNSNNFRDQEEKVAQGHKIGNGEVRGKWRNEGAYFV